MKEFLATDIFIYILRPIIYIGLAYITYKIITLLINRALNSKKVNSKNRKRVQTTISLINNCLKYIIIFLTILLILGSFGLDVSKIFAGLGIMAAVLTLAFQDLAKDFIAGISIVMEDQFEIGDNVMINGFRGDVIEMGLKTTRIRDYKGAVQIIANHTITEVINYSLNPSLAEITISVDYKNDLDKVEQVIRETMMKIDATYENLKGKTELWGVETIDQNSVTYKIVVKTKSNFDFTVQRNMRRDFQEALLKANIKLPQTHMEVHNGK
ncbi:MAG TPA: mechanosensitive ion channel family protein [Candidatus Onthousia faecavium]|nr:mechanosensitive ion channel family protein [Candidatus Onthousia faecavium]